MQKDNFNYGKKGATAQKTSNLIHQTVNRSIYDIINHPSMPLFDRISCIRHQYTNYNSVCGIIDPSTRDLVNSIISEVVNKTVSPEVLSDVNTILDEIRINHENEEKERKLSMVEFWTKNKTIRYVADFLCKYPSYRNHPDILSNELIETIAVKWYKEKTMIPNAPRANDTMDKFCRWYMTKWELFGKTEPLITSLDDYKNILECYVARPAEEKVKKKKKKKTSDAESSEKMLSRLIKGYNKMYK